MLLYVKLMAVFERCNNCGFHCKVNVSVKIHAIEFDEFGIFSVFSVTQIIIAYIKLRKCDLDTIEKRLQFARQICVAKVEQ